MSEKKFMPGPWEVMEWIGYGGPATQLRSEVPGVGSCQVCLISHGDFDKHTDQEVANINLIAAAPDMYEAIKRVVNLVPQEVVECRGDKCRMPWCASCFGWKSAESAIEEVNSDIKKAMSAIAKAEGREEK